MLQRNQSLRLTYFQNCKVIYQSLSCENESNKQFFFCVLVFLVKKFIAENKTRTRLTNKVKFRSRKKLTG